MCNRPALHKWALRLNSKRPHVFIGFSRKLRFFCCNNMAEIKKMATKVMCWLKDIFVTSRSTRGPPERVNDFETSAERI